MPMSNPFVAGAPVLIALVEGPATAEIVRLWDVACQACGGPAYLCRAEDGCEFTACADALMPWDGEGGFP
jgi:hypothetical protein